MSEILLKVTFGTKIKKISIKSPSFEELKIKVGEAYGNLDLSTLELSYTDGDGDVIAIEGDDDLLEANKDIKPDQRLSIKVDCKIKEKEAAVENIDRDKVVTKLDDILSPRKRMSAGELQDKGILKTVIEDKGERLRKASVSTKLESFLGDNRPLPEDVKDLTKAESPITPIISIPAPLIKQPSNRESTAFTDHNSNPASENFVKALEDKRLESVKNLFQNFEPLPASPKTNDLKKPASQSNLLSLMETGPVSPRGTSGLKKPPSVSNLFDGRKSTSPKSPPPAVPVAPAVLPSGIPEPRASSRRLEPITVKEENQPSEKITQPFPVVMEAETEIAVQSKKEEPQPVPATPAILKDEKKVEVTIVTTTAEVPQPEIKVEAPKVPMNTQSLAEKVVDIPPVKIPDDASVVISSAVKEAAPATVTPTPEVPVNLKESIEKGNEVSTKVVDITVETKIAQVAETALKNENVAGDQKEKKDVEPENKHNEGVADDSKLRAGTVAATNPDSKPVEDSSTIGTGRLSSMIDEDIHEIESGNVMSTYDFEATQELLQLETKKIDNLEKTNKTFGEYINLLRGRLGLERVDFDLNDEPQYITYSEALRDDNIYLSTELKKEGKTVKTAKLRWFVLRGNQIEYYTSKADFIGNAKPLGVMSLLDATFDGMRNERYDENGKDVIEWPCMELRDGATNQIWRFSSSNEHEIKMWENRITSKLNELSYVKKYHPVIESKKKAAIVENPDINADLLKYLRSPTAFASTLGLGDSVTHPYTTLKLRGEILALDGAFALSQTLKPQTFLETLILQQALGSGGLLAICSSLGANTSIKTLDLSFNIFTEAALQMLSESMRINKTCQHITLENCLLTNVNTRTLCNLFMAHNFKSVNLRGNYFGPVATTPIILSMSENTYLETLNLSSTGIGNSGAASLGRLAHSCTSLTSLDISHNDISDEGLNSLAKSLNERKQLVRLLLHDNDRISDDGHKTISHLNDTHVLQEASFGRHHVNENSLNLARLVNLYGIAPPLTKK